MPPLRASYSTTTAQHPASTPGASSSHAWSPYSYHTNSPQGGPDYYSHGSSRDSAYQHASSSEPRNVRQRPSIPSQHSYPGPQTPSHGPTPPHHHPHHHSHPHSYTHSQPQPQPQPQPPSTRVADVPMRRARSSSSQSQDAEEGSSPTQGDKGRGNGQGPRTIQSKACVNCRRSKVKCVNDGSGGPCRRCIDIKLECKWRIRVDDEAWRESVDRRFSELMSKIDAIVSRPPAGGRKSDCAPSPSASVEVYQHPEWRNLYNKPGAMLPPPTVSGGRQLASAHSPSYPSFSGSMHKTSPRSDVGSSASTTFNAPSPRERLPPPAMLVSGADVTMSNGDYSSWTPGGRPRSISSANMDSSFPSPLLQGGDSKVATPLPAIARGFSSSQNLDGSSLPPIGRSPPAAYQGSAPQILPDASRRSTTTKLHALPVQWDAGSYASAVSSVGQSDPRLNLIGMGVLPCSKVTELFVFFGKNMQSHSFGFPTFEPNEQMTPLITACISLVASLFQPAGRRHSPAIMKVIAEQANLAGADSLTEEQHLDRELGVGVEEITGLCIAASWLSGEEGNKLAKVARYWALAYLRQFEARMDPQSSEADRSKTYYENLQYLPAYRVINKSMRMRIWLESYIVDAAASMMNGRDLFAPGRPARPICEELREELSKPKGEKGQATRPELSSEDVQLLGHASLLDIFIAARSLKWTSTDAEKSMREVQYLMDDDLEIWRECISKDTDLALNTPAAVDLGLSYYLARAYIGSLALSINCPTGSPRSPHSPPPSTPLSRLQRKLVDQARESAMMALQIAQENMSERLLRLPTWQHFLLSHAANLLIRVLQEPSKWFVTAQSYHILTSVESYARLVRGHLDVHRAQTPCFSSSSSSSTCSGVGVLESSPSYIAPIGPATSTATATGTATGTAMSARGSSSSSSSSHTAVDGASGTSASGAGAGPVGKSEKEENAEASTEGKGEVSTKQAATPTPTGTALALAPATYGLATHPAAGMIEEVYWGAVQMRCRIVG